MGVVARVGVDVRGCGCATEYGDCLHLIVVLRDVVVLDRHGRMLLNIAEQVRIDTEYERGVY
jgi:hypothetical protein